MDDCHFRYITKLEAKRTFHTPSFVHGVQVGGHQPIFQLVKIRQKLGLKI
jgi:hypothetical protein